MRVLILAQYFPPDTGGGATRAYNVAKGLLKVGCTVTVVSAFPHYPTGNVPEKYRWKPLSIEYEGGLKVVRTFVPALASANFVDEGLPTKVFEYQAYGKPVICVSGGEPARYVEGTGSGLVVKPKDAVRLAEAVVRLYKDRKLAAELRWNGWLFRGVAS